ncbi:MAG: exosortase/archaeosortase family protein [Phycisphaeraceae bacterium]
MSAYGYYNAVQVLWHLGAVVAVIGAALTFTGLGVVGKALPAFVVLGLLAPIPGAVRGAIALPLQRATAHATEVIFDLAGMEVLRMGNLLRYNGQDIAVAEACNGMRMVWALLLVSFVVAFGSPLKPYVRVLILVLSPVAALVCNVIPMTPTVLAYGHWSTSAADLFHDLSGWAMVALAFGLVLGFVQLLRWLGLPVERGDGWDRMLEANPPVRGAAT